LRDYRILTNRPKSHVRRGLQDVYLEKFAVTFAIKLNQNVQTPPAGILPPHRRAGRRYPCKCSIGTHLKTSYP